MDESVVRVFEEQQVGTLKLSQAIRIGVQRFPKPSVSWHFGHDGACLLGCIAYAVRGDTKGCYTTWDLTQDFGTTPEEGKRLHEEYLARLRDNPETDPRIQIAEIAESVGY